MNDHASRHMSNRHIYNCLIAFLVLVVTIVIAATTPQRVVACSPTMVIPGSISPTPIPLEIQIARVNSESQIAIDGTVTTWVNDQNMDSVLTIQVERYLKGHGPKTVNISGYFWLCPPNFALEKGSRYIFFVNGDPASTQPFLIRDWFDYQDAVVTGVRNATGQEPVRPDGTYDLLWLIPLAALILGLMIILRKRRAQN